MADKEFNLSEEIHKWKYGFISVSKVKEFIKMLKEELIFSRNKYGLDWCDQLFLKKIDKLAGDKLI